MFLLILLSCGILLPGITHGDPLKSSNHEVAAHQEFAHKLYQLLPKNENVVFCPLSAHSILSLLLEGASGVTFDEIKTALSLQGSKSEIAAGQREISHILQDTKGLTFAIANNMYMAPSLKPKSSFVQQAANSYKAGVENINFTSPDAVDTINNWVSGKTQGKITDLIKQDMLTEQTRAVLINAVYFLGAWRDPFKPSSFPMTFHVSSSETQNVQQMSYEGNINYAQGNNHQIVEFPYVDENYVLRIILPSEVNNLEEVEKNIPQILKTELQPTYIQIYLPKFDIESSIDLKPLLQKLGMVSAFRENSANFKDLSDDPLVISDVFQKSVIKVAEKGTEAAAATGALAIRKKGSSDLAAQILIIKCNRPFSFALIHKTLRIPIFIGRIQRLKEIKLLTNLRLNGETQS